MHDFRQLCKMYRKHGFTVYGRVVKSDRLALTIEAEGKTKKEVYAFANDCLGPGLITQRAGKNWEYEMKG